MAMKARPRKSGKAAKLRDLRPRKGKSASVRGGASDLEANSEKIKR
jgi:hypothetical protein